MQEEPLRAVSRRLRLAVAFARSVEPRSLPSRRALYADAGNGALVARVGLVAAIGGR